jgi:GMP synthase (glutamine-hydrolysing)
MIPSEMCAMPKNILVVEGNARATSEQMESLGGRPYAVSYAALLESISPDVTCAIARPSEDGTDCLPEGKTLSDYDGFVWTGSALSCYADCPEVPNQIEFATDILASGKPVFGSCWGLQIIVTALGGSVRANPNGREIGIGRDIELSEAGETHPMYAGKDNPFDALEVHLDEVETIPDGAVILASNAMSDVQALALETDDVDFWGVQYHPEFDFATVALVMQRLKKLLQDEEIAHSDAEVDEWIAAFSKMDVEDAARRKAFRKFELTPSVIDPAHRHLEIANWLKVKILAAD